jgi:drug/metabolite transporter (DMT)-like permease
MTHDKRTAVFWLFAAMTCFATLDTIAKWLSQSMSIPAAVWFRYTIPTVLLGLWLFHHNRARAFHTTAPWVQLARGVALVISTLCFWAALKHLPLVEAATVSFIGPTLTVVMSALVLREKPEPIHWVALVIGFIGVLIVLRPGFSTPSVGALAALTSAFFYGIYQILTRKVSGSHDSMVMLFYANATGAAVLSLVIPAGLVWPQGWAWSALLGCLVHSGIGA